MLNDVALSLVVTLLAAAGVFGPAPQTNQKHPQLESTIIKEGHRVVVVEYDEDGRQNTKISISPEQIQRENLNEAGSVPPNDASFLHTPKDLICDAFGKCKEKISGAMGKAKGISETVHEALDKPRKEVGDTVGEANESVSQGSHDDTSFPQAPKVSETAQEVARDIARNVSREEAKAAVKNIVHYLGSLVILRSTMNVLRLLGFATAYGLCVWVTFISSYVLCRVIPRQQFEVVQSKIYPVYFRAMAYSIGLALLGHILSHGIKRGFFGKAEKFQAYNLLSSLVTVLVNSIYLEPRATWAMLERMKVEKEEGRGREDIAEAQSGQIVRLNDKLRTLNSYSSFLNILSLMSLTWHLVYLAQLVDCCS